MNKFSIQSFIQDTAQDDSKHSFFELEKPHLLELNLDNQSVMIKKGAMVAYTGNVKFTREGILSKGVGNLLKKAVSGEGTTMMEIKVREEFILLIRQNVYAFFISKMTLSMLMGTMF